MKRLLCVGLLLPGLLGAAVDEEALFGGAPAPAVAPQPTQAPAADLDVDRRGLDAGEEADAFTRGSTKVDPLTLGGTYYQVLQVPFSRGYTEGEQSFRRPLQVDVYLDGRPNDRIRTYVVGRLLYDSSRDAYGNPTAGPNGFSVPHGSSLTAAPLPNNPQVVLDQAWLKFDVDRVLFVSLGRQHVKWGSGRIWNPSDALNPQRRDPLQPYDLRLGRDMGSVQLPIRWQQSNLYGILLFDNPEPASTAQQLGGAVRFETLLGPAELGLSAVGRSRELPRYGVDLSGPLGPFDAYVELAFLSNDGRLVQRTWLGVPAGPPPSLHQIYATDGLPGAALQAVAGLNYSFAWTENRSATLGAEYFYNELGVTDGHLYPVLLYLDEYTPFYLAKHYAALYFSAEGPDSGKKTTYNLSAIANLNDASLLSRLDFRWLMLDYLSLGIWASGNFGKLGGEFNFTLDTPALWDGGTFIPPVHYAGTSGEAGMSLRVAF